MALAGRVQRVQAKHEKLREARPWGDQDRREARHAMYKAIISWQFCSPLGAGKRVRLPKCLVSAVRRKFPNPVCAGQGATIGPSVSARGITRGSAPRKSRVPCVRGDTS